jgi:hypothetical protein
MLVIGTQLSKLVPPSIPVPTTRQMRKLFPSYSLQALLGALSIFRNTWTPFFLFRISYYYSCLIGAVVTIIAAFVINQVINRNGSYADRDLISPVCHFLLPDDPETDTRVLETLVTTPKDNEN